MWPTGSTFRGDERIILLLYLIVGLTHQLSTNNLKIHIFLTIINLTLNTKEGKVLLHILKYWVWGMGKKQQKSIIFYHVWGGSRSFSEGGKHEQAMVIISSLK